MEQVSYQDWSNEDNRAFYQNMSIDEFKHFSIPSHLAEKKDIQNISKLISAAYSILEVNAGFGRVIDGVFELRFKGEVTAIERMPSFCQYLRKKYRQRCHIIEGDILFYDFKDKYDVILFMWSSIAEFSPSEQRYLIVKLSKLLNTGGHIVIDILESNATLPHARKSESQQIEIKHHQTVRGHLPTDREWQTWFQVANVSVDQLIRYQLTDRIKRKCYVITQN
jgi:SAM-dependent methyltransferase